MLTSQIDIDVCSLQSRTAVIASKGWPLLLSVGAGLLLASTFAPVDFGGLAWFGLAPLLLVLRRSTFLAAALHSFLFGWVLNLGTIRWVARLEEMSVVNFLLILFAVSLSFVVFGVLYRLLAGRIGPWLLLVGAPALWVMVEYGRANLFFLAWPYNLLGHSQYRYLPLIQIAGVTGVYGLSFLLVLVNQFLSQLLDRVVTRPSGRVIGAEPSSRHAWALHLLTVALPLLLTVAYGVHALCT